MRYATKTSTKEFCDTIAAGFARYEKYRYWASKQPRPLQRSVGPFRPEMPKKSRKCFPGPPAPEPRKVLKKSREQSAKSPESLRKVSKECFFGLFPRLFGDFSGFRGRRPRETFSRLFRHFRPEGPERPLQGAGWFPTKTSQSQLKKKTISTLIQSTVCKLGVL